mmetsp:Transcript_93582/g.195096  ORF Transcript_93582/g.195096 Transcript_93582/m.195096 type:complete len:355 (-) Transcript_93582:46-1110(-)
MTPVGDANGHAILHGSSQVSEIVRTGLCFHHQLAALLVENCSHPRELSHCIAGPICPCEIGFNLERLRGVDRMSCSWTIRTVWQVLSVASETFAVAIVELRCIGWITPVRSCLQDHLICLHDVHLRTPLAAYHVGIAVVGTVAASARGRIATFIPSWLLNNIHGHVAGTPNLAHVNGKGQRPAQEGKVLESIRVPSVAASRRDANACVVVQPHRLAIFLQHDAAACDVSFVNTIDGQLAHAGGRSEVRQQRSHQEQEQEGKWKQALRPGQQLKLLQRRHRLRSQDRLGEDSDDYDDVRKGRTSLGNAKHWSQMEGRSKGRQMWWWWWWQPTGQGGKAVWAAATVLRLPSEKGLV